MELGGTLSGEHGIGLSKQPFLGKALTPETINLMKTLKQALDPRWGVESGQDLG